MGFEGFYEVSNRGNLRSLDRIVLRSGSPYPIKGQLISPWRSSPSNYLTVTLKREGRKTNRRIHVLVCEAWHGPRPSPELEACHDNGDQDDNRPENLRWDTKTSNAQDVIRHGRNANRNRTHCKRKHEFTTENTYINPSSGGRQCRQCVREARGHLPRR